jgi:hypothetical protein
MTIGRSFGITDGELMTYIEQWSALASRIRGLTSAAELYSRFQAYHLEDMVGAGPYLRQQCAAAVESVEEFRRDFAESLPPEAIQCIDHFLKRRLATAAKKPENREIEAARGAVVGLAVLEAEVSFILSGRQEQIRCRSERAFLLLNRVLAVDEDARGKWKSALKEGEVACEQLGAVHLLSQGIFAFKVNALGARTDLVFNEPPDTPALARAVDGLILTEWKLVKPENAAGRYDEAREQAKLYKSGALAGLELAGYRYLVGVSESQLPFVPPDSVTSSGIVYRHINIAVEPKPPSKAAIRVGNRG